jgi:hypothetical protein
MRKQGVFGIEDEAGEYSPGLRGVNCSTKRGLGYNTAHEDIRITKQRREGETNSRQLEKGPGRQPQEQEEAVKILWYQRTMPA